MLKLAPDYCLFAEFLGCKSEKRPEGFSATDHAPHFTGADRRLQNLDSHRTTPVSSFEHHRRPTVIHGECRGFNAAVHNFDRLWDMLVMVTQSVQLIQSSCSFPYIRRILFQNLNPRLRVDYAGPLNDLLHPNGRSRSCLNLRAPRHGSQCSACLI